MSPSTKPRYRYSPITGTFSAVTHDGVVPVRMREEMRALLRQPTTDFLRPIYAAQYSLPEDRVDAFRALIADGAPHLEAAERAREAA